MSVLDYSLCRDKVTIYRLDGQQVLRQVVDGCMLNLAEKLKKEDFGEVFTRPSLFILPENRGDVRLGDRVLRGEGPEVTVEQWPRFLPALQKDLMEVRTVKPYYWEGRICHVEAEG